MKNYINIFIDSIEKKDPSILPTASRYKATEDGKPAALCHMSTWRMIDKVNLVGTSVIDPELGQIYVVLNVNEGSMPVILGARLKIANEVITEIELDFYRSRADVGFWFAEEEMVEHVEMWESITPEDQRATREELQELAEVIYDNTKKVEYASGPNCFLMETGGIVRENTGYGRLINPHIADQFPEEDIRVPIPFGVAPNRPNGKDIRIIALDVEKGLLVVSGVVDGYVSPYIVSDETSTCFVPMSMIDNHRLSLLPELFEGKSVFEEMLATGETFTIIKYGNKQIISYMQYVSMKSYGTRSPWGSVQ